MAKLNVAPTKSNLLAIKEQLVSAQNGYELLEQKREILVMELMHMVERVKLLESEMDKEYAKAYYELLTAIETEGTKKTAAQTTID